MALSLSLTMPDQIVGTWLRFPNVPDWTLEFLGQAVLIPVCWRLHLLSQLVPTAYYAIVYPLLGITQIGERSTYNIYTVGILTTLFLVCLICDMGVYLYERLQQSEFESRQQLRIFLHSVSHDLKTPVMGTSIVLETLLANPNLDLTIERSVLERLLQGSDRQLTLINSLLEAHNTEVQGIQLHCDALSLRAIVDAVVADLTPILLQNQIILDNHIPSDLPLVWADANQLWRVYCNLITNAIKHNPHHITLTLTATLIHSVPTPSNRWFRWQWKKPLPTTHSLWMKCTVTDNGVGIPPHQCQRLFDLYFRGARARYMPGLGLGLYVCKQAIAAHGGDIGIDSVPGSGSTFWFTLPLAISH
ncbi:MAG: HAMP domain-containing histidine kinase [Leptolyngbyaceae cyanobacterium SL_7_1]|nr:HAMP domain-containing histidine kinase [Leptolyngbyaceae cyanobacterium SL_7_1]